MESLDMCPAFALLPHSELCTQLDLEYPNGWFITGYLEIFLSLPREVLALLLYQRKDIVLLLPTLCKLTRKGFELLWFSVASVLPPQPREIWGAVRTDGIRLMAKLGTPGKNLYSCDIALYSSTEENEILVSEIETGVISGSSSVHFELMGDFNYEMCDFYPQEYDVEPFDAYHIFSKRKGCMRWDAMYARKALHAQVASAMIFHAYDLPTPEGVRNHLWLNYMAVIFAPEEKILMVDGEININKSRDFNNTVLAVGSYLQIINNYLSSLLAPL